MRGTFIQTLVELAEEDSRILMLTGDLGFMAVEPFLEAFPNRFFNVGVAEQNMVGLATGLAEAGYIPFVYSIATFASLRPYEFIRNGPVLHQFPVRIIGVGGGFEYGTAGTTHHGLEDVGVMRVQPGLAVIAPADFKQARVALQKTWNFSGPVYYRIGKDDQTVVPGLEGRFELGKIQIVREGVDLLILTLGSIVHEAMAAADDLSALGIDCAVAVVACISPAPVVDLVHLLPEFDMAMTVEAHYCVGGLGSLVSEVVADHGMECRVVRCGVRSVAGGRTGSQAFLHQIHGLSRQGLVEKALRALVKRKDHPEVVLANS